MGLFLFACAGSGNEIPVSGLFRMKIKSVIVSSAVGILLLLGWVAPGETAPPSLYADFGGSGLWQWDGSIWSHETPANPENMVISDSDLYVDFGGNGIWEKSGTVWSKITSSNPENMVVDKVSTATNCTNCQDVRYRYVGITSQSFGGYVSWITLNQACASEYPNSKWATTYDVLHTLNPLPSVPQSAWISLTPPFTRVTASSTVEDSFIDAAGVFTRAVPMGDVPRTTCAGSIVLTDSTFNEVFDCAGGPYPVACSAPY